MSKHIIIKTPDEISIIAENGKILSQIFRELDHFLKSGISTKEIDQYIESFIRKAGGIPSFKGYGGFTGSACISINDVVIHGIPNSKDILKEGDIVSVDIGVLKNGFHADSARTFAIGDISQEAKDLLRVTQSALQETIKIIRPGKTLFDIANKIQNSVEMAGKQYGIVRDFVGHGIGKDLHEAPQVPNFRQNGLSKIKLQTGMVLAIEPMITIGSGRVFVENDGWTVRSEERGLAAHFEHTVALVTGGCYILTQ